MNSRMPPHSFQNIGEFAEWFTLELKKAQYQNISGALISVLADESGNAIASRALFAANAIKPRGVFDYEFVKLCEDWISRDDLYQQFLSKLDDIIIVSETPILYGCTSVNLRSAIGPLGTFSGKTELAAYCILKPRQFTDSQPLTRCGMPQYFSPSHAAHEFVFQSREMWRHGDMHLGGQLIIVLPDIRASMAARWDHHKAKVFIEIQSQIPESDLEFQLIANAPQIYRDQKQAVKCGSMEIEVPPNAVEILLSLLHSDGSILSRIWLTNFQRAVGMEEPPRPSEETENDLRNGENEHVEFKPFIAPKDEKEREILEAIIAFANTDGGRLYLGVNRDGSPQEIKELYKQKYTGQHPIEQARCRLRELIQEGIKPAPQCKIEITSAYDHELIFVRVTRGDQHRYSTRDSHEMFIRKGSSNRRPDPETELPNSSNYSQYDSHITGGASILSE